MAYGEPECFNLGDALCGVDDELPADANRAPIVMLSCLTPDVEAVDEFAPRARRKTLARDDRLALALFRRQLATGLLLLKPAAPGGAPTQPCVFFTTPAFEQLWWRESGAASRTKAAFDQIDTNGDGELSFIEFEAGAKALLHVGATDDSQLRAELRSRFDAADTNKSGKLCYAEFVELGQECVGYLTEGDLDGEASCSQLYVKTVSTPCTDRRDMATFMIDFATQRYGLPDECTAEMAAATARDCRSTTAK